MKFGLRALALAMLMLAAATAASADSLTLVNGGNYTMGGVYVGPYNFSGTINGQNVSLQLICDDFKSDVTTGETWNVNVSTVPSPFSTLGTPSQYQQVSYLAELIFGLDPNSSGYGQTLGELQWAIWNVFDPGVGVTSGNPDPYGTLTSTQISAIQGYITQAQNNAGLPGNNYANLLVYTPIAGTQTPAWNGLPQEYIGDPPANAPEPGTMLLMGAGFAGLLLFRRLSF
ncbi:MAG TPA: PEP-CTERM sorting domain-containing protein [Candidatus Binatia bacterium]|nr:PEP-CTERM sorting domain-containing protein [Candidatus Binatia bacterium]